MASFAKHLTDDGWDLKVLSVKEKHLGSKDDSLTSQVDHIETIRTPIWQPHDLFGRITGDGDKKNMEASLSASSSHGGYLSRVGAWARAALFVPDARVAWRYHGVRAALELMGTEGFDVVLTSAPPFTVHLIGAAIRDRTGVPWVADFRDPWLGAYFGPKRPSWARAIEKRQEQRVLNTADGVTTVGPWLEKMLKQRNPNVETVFNGYDGDSPETEPQPPERFRVVYVGTINDAEHPGHVFKAAEMIAKRREDFRESVSLETAGRVGNEMPSQWKASSIGDSYRHHGFVPHQKAVELMQEAALLVVIIPEAPTANGILSGKLMEYLGTGRAILVVGPIDGDAAWIVEHTGTGQTAPNDPESLEPLIEQVFDRFLRHQGCPDRDHNRVKQFSRSSQARVLSKFLRRIVDAGGHTRSTA